MAILSTAEREALLQRAIVIRDEIMHKANTANRVGSLFYDIVRSLAVMDLDELRQYFLRKDVDDETLHVLSMAEAWIKGNAYVHGELTANSVIAKDLRVTDSAVVDKMHNAGADPDALEGIHAKGFLYKMDEDGYAHLFIDFLTVRLKSYFAELEIRKLSYVGGSIVLTPTGGQVAYVKEVKSGNDVTGYKCYMTADDGTMATINTWKVGDQARCQTFNLDGAGKYSNVSNRYYWRLVTDAGQERVNGAFEVVEEGDEGYEEALVVSYVVLSNRISETINGTTYKGYDDSSTPDIPSQGDELVGMGNQKEPNNRGNIIMMRTVDEDERSNAPSVTLYQGVGSSPNPYSLGGHAILNFSPKDGFSVVADSFKIKSTPTDANATPINQYLCVHTIECSAFLVNSSSLHSEPVILGGEMASTLYAVEFGGYFLHMAEEAEGYTAVIKCRAAIQSYLTKEYITGTLLAENMRGSEVVSVIDASTTGELQFTYSQIDTTCDHIRITLTIDGEEKAVASIGIVKDGKPGDKGYDAEFDTLEDLGSSARIYFEDSYNDGVLTGTTMKLNASVTAVVKHVVGDSSSVISDLSNYALEASYSYNRQIHTIQIPKKGGTFYFNNSNAESGQQGYIAIAPSLLNSLSKTLTLTLIKDNADVQTIDIPIVLDENQSYTRTKKMMESLYASGGDFSVIRQMAAQLALQVGDLGDGLSLTGIDIIRRLITLTADNLVCMNNENEKTMWINAVGTLGVSGNIYTGSCNINSAQRLAQYFRADTIEGVNTSGESAQVQGAHCLLSYMSTNSPWQSIWSDFGDEDVIQVADIFRLADLVVFRDIPMDGKVLLLPYVFPVEARQGPGTTPVVRYDVCRTVTDYKTGEEHLITLDELRMLVGKEFTIMNDSGEEMRIYAPYVANGTIRHSFENYHDVAGLTFQYVCEEFTIPYGTGELQHIEGIYPKLINTFMRLLEPVSDDFEPQSSTD